MSQPDFAPIEPGFVSSLKAGDAAAFARLYDRYAGTLLGIITKIVDSEAQAIASLEQTFVYIRSEIEQFQPDRQSLFVWLVFRARRSAIETLNKCETPANADLSLTETGKVIPFNPLRNRPPAAAGSADMSPKQSLTKLVDAVLFGNCTPEEAAQSVGLPAGTARQQLRSAMQHLQNITKRAGY